MNTVKVKREDFIDDDAPMDANVVIYLLLKNKLVVYVGIDSTGERLNDHYRKRLIFDDVIETPDGPYSKVEALRRERILIRCFRPKYNQQHAFARLTKEEERECRLWLSQWPEGNDAMCARIERILRIDLALGTYA